MVSSRLDRKEQIRVALAAMQGVDFPNEAKVLLSALGYRSDRVLDGQSGTVDDFLKQFTAQNPDTRTEQEFRENAASVHVLFQVTDEEIAAGATHQSRMIGGGPFDTGNVKSFLFAAVELNSGSYPRSKYADFTREVNKRFPRIPAVVCFRTVDGLLTVAFVHVRPNKRNPERGVLGSVSFIREIDLADPHRAHLDILAELSLEERLGWIDSRRQPRNFDGLLDAWLNTLDTEELNKRFYQELEQWFDRAVASAMFPSEGPRAQSAEEHVIRLITRLMFVWFVKEKGLVADELFIEEQVRGLLKDYDAVNGDSYYRTILQNLFFATLNTESGQRGFSNVDNSTHRNFSRYRYRSEMSDPDALLELFEQTPFINGGLFDCLDSEEATGSGGWRIDCFTDNPRERRGYSIPNRLFFDDAGLVSIFRKYKFTVEENTPAEQEVALDPELLGKVFENLLAATIVPETKESARKQTGSFYTPRVVVDYMVDEALVAALAQHARPSDGDSVFWQERLRYLLDYSDAGEVFNEAETDSLIRAIAELKVLDPAVGSGAFPMGVLHKLTLALRRLDLHNERWEVLQKELAGERAKGALNVRDQQERDAELLEISDTFERYRDSDFGRKLYLIQNSIYGVDIQPVACQIAKLRFFISLAIEQQPDPAQPNHGVKPLPNLETRFVAADTLLGLEKPIQGTLGQTDAVMKLEQALTANRERHFHAGARREKLRLRNEDKRLRGMLEAELIKAEMPAPDAHKVAQWDPYDQNASADWFDAEYMFGISAGFDLVIGNPPYAKVENQTYRTRNLLESEYAWSGDLYDYFIVRGFRLAADYGLLCYIANDSFVAFSQKRRIRDLMLSNQLRLLTRAPAQTFEASIYAAIFLLSKQAPTNTHSYVSGEIKYPEFQYEQHSEVFYSTIHSMPDKKLLLSDESSLVSRLMSFPKIHTVCHVLDTGIDSGNVRRKIFFTHNNGHRARLLQGRQISRYSLWWNHPSAQYKYCDIYYEPLPVLGIGRGGKPSSKNEYWGFRGDIDNHHQPERLLMRQTDDDLVVAYHNEGTHGQFYTDNTLFTILPRSSDVNLKYLCALFNSSLINYVYHFISQEKGKGQAQVKIRNVKDLPVVIPNPKTQGILAELVDQVISRGHPYSVHTMSDEKAEINRLVYDLYGLTEEEIAVVEGRDAG